MTAIFCREARGGARLYICAVDARLRIAEAELRARGGAMLHVRALNVGFQSGCTFVRLGNRKIGPKEYQVFYWDDEGRLHITPAASGLIGWTGSIQIVKTIHDEMCDTINV